MGKNRRERERYERIKDTPDSDPVDYADHLRRQREWYQSLSDDDYHRIYVQPRR